eukprot:304215-Alexandrium_andersonii.AAC.1
MSASLVGSEMCIRDSSCAGLPRAAQQAASCVHPGCMAAEGPVSVPNAATRSSSHERLQAG